MIVKIYSYLLPVLKRIGWHKLDNTPFFVWFKQRLVHILVICLTVVSIFINLSSKTKANDLVDNSPKTILADLVQSEFGESTEDEELIIETFDQEPTISSLQQSYLDNLSAVRPQLWVKNGEDSEEVDEEMVTIQNGSSVVKPEIATTQKTKRPRNGNFTYEIKPGDTISTIAEEFEISVTSILWENNLTAYSVIRPGDKLVILPATGITHTVVKGENMASIAKKYGISEQEILAANKIASAGSLQINQKLFIPGGKKLYSGETTSSKIAKNTNSGYSVIKNFVKGSNAKPVAGNKMNWPTLGHRITQYFSWRHYGLDIANKIGTPIYAADAGTIELTGWGQGYGNQIVINHGGGKKTRYAHLSKINVIKGEKVSKGEEIGKMGSTGWSTGPHLHFEIFINSTKLNPLNYIK